MTALKEYARLEASGLWRATAEHQRREVVVSFGDATLTISDLQDRPLAHWSLAAIERLNPGQTPAIYSPHGDPGEALEFAAEEATMIDAIERLRRAVDRSRPRPGRLRQFIILTVCLAIAAVTVFWLPGALIRHTVTLVPFSKREDIGRALLASVEQVSGRACQTRDSAAALSALAQRAGVRRLFVVPAGIRDSLYLPGSIVLLNKAVIEEFEDPAVAAGYILAERSRIVAEDPLEHLLQTTGPVSAFRLLTTGSLPQETLRDYSQVLLSEAREAPPADTLLALFEQTGISSTPYAYARDRTGETVLDLIEADPMAGKETGPILQDRDWVLLQSICGG